MFLLDEHDTRTVVTSASDLTAASKCEFAFARTLDAKLERIDALDVPPDPMLVRAGRLGDEHERRQLQRYRDEGLRIIEVARPRSMSREHLRAAADETIAAFDSGAEVVFQATFFDEGAAPFIGFADFIVRTPGGAYRVQDTKLARSVKVTALLQLAAYHDQLTRLGITADDTVELLLGDGETSAHLAADILPVFRNRRDRMLRLVRDRQAASAATQWGDPGIAICGRCDHCAAEVAASNDLLQVAGMRLTQRARLREVGILSLHDLAAATGAPPGMAARTFDALRAQAQLQVEAVGAAELPYQFFDTAPIANLPAPDAGDIFFDFEGDPLYREGQRWGIDYLFGLVDVHEAFTAFWAHDLEQEKLALQQFLEFVVARRARHPGMHIYHYASYERTHLSSIAARHGVGEHIVDELLRDGVLVDLYSTVRKSLRVGGPSYSIKKLEPLYMGDQRQGVTDAGDSIEQYQRSRQTTDVAEAQAILDTIAEYNEYDCRSTLRLRDWLIEASGVTPGAAPEPTESDPFEPSPLSVVLLERAGDDTDGPYALAAAAIDYFRRENKSFWWEHFARLSEPMDHWADSRGVFIVDAATVEAGWGRTGQQRLLRRRVRANGTWAPGSGTPSGAAFALYEQPAPFTRPRRRVGAMLDVEVTIVTDDDGSVWIDEICPSAAQPWTELPVAITPGAPPRAGNVEAAIAEWATGVAAAESWPADAASGILTRQPPRGPALTGAPGSTSAVDSGGAGTEGIVVASLLALDRSYLAVQGPPGTGKTYLAASVITTLVRDHGWRIGVVAQSHKVVEHVLNRVVEVGLEPQRVGKVGKEAGSFTDLGDNGHPAFAARNPDGYVIGGTAWDFTNLRRIDRGQLDLLVIDEAGQFSLAATIAVAVSARNLLLLGDPQQLPQVSQGVHPAPVDQAALGYLAGGHPVLPAELGYFLAESRRMHPAVTAPVSRLAYEGALRSHPDAALRHLDGVEPGLHPVAVAHADNATASIEEADAVVRLVAQHMGATWTDGTPRPLEQRDVIVVTPYNAQRELVRSRLDAAGLRDVPVGTVDKFQGQEAVIAIVSLAASSPADVPRGLSFLLSRNRLNVAISRAQWAAYLLYSPELIEYLPITPDEVAELSRFIELVSG